MHIRRNMTILMSVLMLHLACACGWGEEAITPRVFHVNNVKASDMEKLIKIFLSKDGMSVSDDRSFVIIVKDYPSVLEKIEAFIKEQDKPAPNVSISVRFNDATSQSISGWGLSVVGVNNSWMAGVWGGSSSSSGSVSGTMNMVTMSNTWGEISIGENVPYPEWFFVYARDSGLIASIPVYRQVSTGFAVCPVVRGGNELDVTIAPQISYFTDRERGTIRFDNAATTMRVASGQTIVLASGNSEQSVVIRRIFGSMNMSQSQSVVMMLTPVILNY